MHDHQQAEAAADLNKVVVSSQETDPGLFNLQIDGQTAGTRMNVGDGGMTGAQNVASGVDVAVGETAGTGTSLEDYVRSTVCAVNGGDSQDVPQVNLAYGDTAVCTITNKRRPQVNVVKQLVPENDPGKFDLTINATIFTGPDGVTGPEGGGIGDGQETDRCSEDGEVDG